MTPVTLLTAVLVSAYMLFILPLFPIIATIAVLVNEIIKVFSK